VAKKRRKKTKDSAAAAMRRYCLEGYPMDDDGWQRDTDLLLMAQEYIRTSFSNPNVVSDEDILAAFSQGTDLEYRHADPKYIKLLYRSSKYLLIEVKGGSYRSGGCQTYVSGCVEIVDILKDPPIRFSRGYRIWATGRKEDGLMTAGKLLGLIAIVEACKMDVTKIRNKVEALRTKKNNGK
jgi:hypothetical protein